MYTCIQCVQTKIRSNRSTPNPTPNPASTPTPKVCT